MPARVSILRNDAVVVDVFCEAADAVAAHFRLAAVGVDNAHPHVGLIAGHDDDDAVGADSRMAVAHFHGQFGKILVRAFLIFKKYEIVS